MEVRVKRTDSDELYHYGVKGQKWGVRRYQNADGSLTSAGRKRIRKLNTLDAKDNYDRMSKHQAQSNIQRFGNRNDAISKILTKTNKKQLSRLHETIERNDKKIKSIIDELNSQNVDLVVSYDPLKGRMVYKQSAYAVNNKRVKELSEKYSIDELKTMRDKEYLEANRYRGKAYGTGNILDGTYKPPKDTSDEAFAKNMRESDKHYDKGDEYDRARKMNIEKAYSKRMKSAKTSEELELLELEMLEEMEDYD